jgi:hypothetical protein
MTVLMVLGQRAKPELEYHRDVNVLVSGEGAGCVTRGRTLDAVVHSHRTADHSTSTTVSSTIPLQAWTIHMTRTSYTVRPDELRRLTKTKLRTCVGSEPARCVAARDVGWCGGELSRKAAPKGEVRQSNQPDFARVIQRCRVQPTQCEDRRRLGSEEFDRRECGVDWTSMLWRGGSWERSEGIKNERDERREIRVKALCILC